MADELGWYSLGHVYFVVNVEDQILKTISISVLLPNREKVELMETSWEKLPGVKLSRPVLQTLKELGFKKTTPVQVNVLAN